MKNGSMVLNWIDWTNPSPEKILELPSTMEVVSTHVKDCLDPYHLPKMEIIGETVFIIMRYLDPTPQSDTIDTNSLTRKLVFFITPTQLLTIHRAEEIPFITKLKNDLNQQDFSKKNWDHHNVAIYLMRKCVDSYDPFLEKIENKLTDMEMELFNKQIDESSLLEMHHQKRQLYLVKKLLNLTNITLREVNFTAKKYNPYLQDLREVGHAQYIFADDLVDQSTTLIQTFITISDYRANQVMKILTMLSMFFLPLTFITGLYGMNFHDLPELSWEHGYAYFWALVIIITSSIYFYFRRRGWLK